jgi:hypothetical protein
MSCGALRAATAQVGPGKRKGAVAVKYRLYCDEKERGSVLGVLEGGGVLMIFVSVFYYFIFPL